MGEQAMTIGEWFIGLVVFGGLALALFGLWRDQADAVAARGRLNEMRRRNI